MDYGPIRPLKSSTSLSLSRFSLKPLYYRVKTQLNKAVESRGGGTVVEGAAAGASNVSE